ncbi:hypothetical protein FS837_001401 [Tulasnella sp. UAMH 9824]|nr:hypothetical protein FS837_001401 [Tulasnella sp. UAMH 9824]
MKDDATSLRVHQSVQIDKHLEPECVPFWVETRLINRNFILPRIFYEDPVRGTLLLARRNKNEVYPPDRKDSPTLDPSRCTGVWFRPTKKIAKELQAVEQDMVDVFERIKTKTEVAGDMPLAGYLRQLWDHFLYTLAAPTRTFGTLEKPFPLLSVSEPHMQNALANKALGRSYKTGALFCQGTLLVPSSPGGKAQPSAKTDGVSKKTVGKGRVALKIMSPDEDEDSERRNDSNSSEDKSSNRESEKTGPMMVQGLQGGEKAELVEREYNTGEADRKEWLRRLYERRTAERPRSDEKAEFAAAQEFGRDDTRDTDRKGRLKGLHERRATERRRSADAGKGRALAYIFHSQPVDEDDPRRQRRPMGPAGRTAGGGNITEHQDRIMSPGASAEVMQLDEEDIDGVELVTTEGDDGFTSIQGDLLQGLNARSPKNGRAGVGDLSGDHESSEEEFFGSITPADDDLSDWMPIHWS